MNGERLTTSELAIGQPLYSLKFRLSGIRGEEKEALGSGLIQCFPWKFSLNLR
jgi:hypothetical protein